MTEPVAMIGLGQMGGAIALRLRACGADVVGYDVAEAARRIEATESRIREQIVAGKTLGEARATLGYHTLQRKGI